MPRWRKGRGGFDAPIGHLSADRLGDMVDAERSSPPDLPKLNLPHSATEAAPVHRDSPVAAERLVNGRDESALLAETPPAETPPAEVPQAEAPQAVTPQAVTPPPSDASSLAVKTSALSKTGRHRRPTSLRSMALGFRRGIFTAHTLVLMGLVGVLVVATAVLGVS